MRYRLAMSYQGERLYLEGMTAAGRVCMVDEPAEAITFGWGAAVALAWVAEFGDELELEEVRDA
jgi:hypothetical protein